MQYTLKPIEDSDIDSMFILPLAQMPLQTVPLRDARMIKNGHLQSVVEFFRGEETGSGQMEVEDAPERFGWEPSPLHPDLILIRRLSLMPSYDVYSLRIALREAGIAVSDIAWLRLSPEKAEELSRYMVTFTRPLLKLIFADDDMQIESYADVLALFRDPDAKKVRDRLNNMASSLKISVQDVPNFLEDYGDTFLSLSYFRYCLERLSPYFEACIDSLKDIRKNYQCKQNYNLMKACDRVEAVTGSLRTGVAKRLTLIETKTQEMFTHMSQEEFRKVRSLIEVQHLTIGAILCGLTVKMDMFSRIFPHENAGGPVRRGDFMLNDMLKSIDMIREHEKR